MNFNIKNVKYHIMGALILVTAVLLLAVPLGYYCYTFREKIFHVKSKDLYTRRDFETAFGVAKNKMERGLYDDAHKILKIAAEHVLVREFACEAITAIGDFFYFTKYTEDKVKYRDALFFYLLAATQTTEDPQEIWRYFQVANCHRRLGYELSAMTDYDVFINNFPESEYVEKAKLSLASLLIKRKRLNKANEIILELVDNTQSQNVLEYALFLMAEMHISEAEIITEQEAKKNR